MSKITKVENNWHLQNLVTYVILSSNQSFSLDEFVDKIMAHPYFNNFCSREKVKNITHDTLLAFLRTHYVSNIRGKYYAH